MLPQNIVFVHYAVRGRIMDHDDGFSFTLNMVYFMNMNAEIYLKHYDRNYLLTSACAWVHMCVLWVCL